MKKVFKKIALAGVAACAIGALAVPMTSCTPKSAATKIGFVFYKNSGDDIDSVKAFLGNLEEPLNLKFEYAVGSSYKESDNIAAIENLGLKGCKGVVISLCGDTFANLVKTGKDAGMYTASWYGVPEDYFYYDSTNTSMGGGIASDELKSIVDQYYVGGVEDGVRTGDDGGVYLAESYFKNVVIDARERNIGMMHFNFTYYPKQKVAVDTFITKVNAWNADSAHANDKITLYDVGQNEDGTYKTSTAYPGNYYGDASVANVSGNLGWSLGFAAIEDTYFEGNGHDGMTSICCFGAAGSFVYPVVAQKQKTYRVYGSGYDSNSDGFSTDFGDGKIMRQTTWSNVESVVYPLVLLLNKLNGTEFADNYQQKAADNIYLNTDKTDKRISSYYNYVTDKTKLTSLKSSCLYMTHDAKDALLSVDQVKNLLPQYNKNATYANLLKTVQGLKSDK